MDSPDNIKKIIDARNTQVAHWYAEGKIDLVATVFSVDAWQMPPNSPALVGREAIRAFWSQAVQWGKWEFTLNAQQVDVSGSMAVERGKYRLKFTAIAAPPGMNSFEDWGNYLVHWRRETDGEWRIVGDAPVSERPLSPPPGP